MLAASDLSPSPQALSQVAVTVNIPRQQGLFDPAEVRRLVALNDSQRVDGTYTIFAMICIEIWCRMFVDRPVPELI